MWTKKIKPFAIAGAAAMVITLAPGLAVAQTQPPLQNGPYGAAPYGQMPARQMSPPMSPQIGTVNYIQGQVSVNGAPVTAAQMGRMGIGQNDVLNTGVGKAEILLTPGVFLRLGNNAGVRMISTDLAAPRVEVVSGEALIEVDRNIPNARVDVMVHGADAAIVKAGLYRFNATTGDVAVYDGKVDVNFNGQSKEISGGHEIALNGGPLKSVHFDKKSRDDLYVWSNVRSNYLAEASGSMAQNIYAGESPYWGGTGWYWDPYFDAWSWLPGDGLFWSPFGYPFYSAGLWPYYGGFYGHGGYGHGFGHGWNGHGGAAGFTGHAGLGSAAIARSGGFHGSGFAGGGGFHGGGFGGGGFHGGGGGFHGGGGGGRR